MFALLLVFQANLLLPGGLTARCLVPHNESLISGNDGGYINIIEVANGSFELKSCLTKVEGLHLLSYLCCI